MFVFLYLGTEIEVVPDRWHISAFFKRLSEGFVYYVKKTQTGNKNFNKR